MAVTVEDAAGTTIKPGLGADVDGTAFCVSTEPELVAITGEAAAGTTLKPELRADDDGKCVSSATEPMKIRSEDAAGFTLTPGLGADGAGAVSFVSAEPEMMAVRGEEGDDANDLFIEQIWQLKKFSSVVVKPQILHLNAPNCDQTDPLPSPRAVTAELFTLSAEQVFFFLRPFLDVAAGEDALLLSGVLHSLSLPPLFFLFHLFGPLVVGLSVAL